MTRIQEEAADEPAMESKTAQGLDLLRQHLISVGNRSNPLVNFRPTRRYLELSGIDADAVFSHLVENENSIGFNERVEPELTGLVEPELVGLDDAECLVGNRRANVRNFQTELSVDDLDSSLRRLEYESRSQVQELGYSSLYIAMGFVRYFESKSSNDERLAPLVLVPVELKRANVNSKFRISYTGSEIGTNIALRERLRADFDTEIPEVDEDMAPSQVFKKVRDAVTERVENAGWSVDPHRMCLGFFSFSSFIMYRDLDPKNWQGFEFPGLGVLQRLLGDGFGIARASSSGITSGKSAFPPELEPVILDADSSQMEALRLVREGQDVVIQGPPGTGKSQTISNIIVDSVAHGKKVLFVAEKLVALEVVKRKLDEAEVGQFALELHSHRSTRRAVIAEVRSTLQNSTAWAGFDGEELLGAVNSRIDVDRQDYFRSVRELNDYVDAVKAPILSSGLTYASAAAQFQSLNDPSAQDEAKAVRARGIEKLPSTQLEDGLRQLRGLAEQYERIGRIEKHPLRFIKKIEFTYEHFLDARDLIDQAEEAIVELTRAVAPIADAIDFTVPETIRQAERCLELAQRALDAPRIDDVPVGDDRWDASRDEITSVIRIGSRLRDIRAARAHQVADYDWRSDLSHNISVWRNKGRNALLRWFSSEFKSVRQELARKLDPTLVKDYAQCSAVLDDIEEYHRLNAKLEGIAPGVSNLFGRRWRGLESDWDDLQALADWVFSLRRDVTAGLAHRVALDWTVTGPDLSFNAADLSDARSLANRIKDSIAKANDIFNADIAAGDGPWDDMPLVDLSAKLGAISGMSRADFDRYERFLELKQEFESGDLHQFSELAEAQQYNFTVVERTIRRSWLSALVDHALSNSPTLRRFNPKTHERIVEEFAHADRQLCGTAKVRAWGTHQSRLPPTSSIGQVGLLRREFTKKTRHLPIRTLMREAGATLQRIKPVFMMSPMSVAKFLPKGTVEFDLVIFDEASQMRAADALGAVLRGRQTVVVGDRKQLPPTDFFLKMADPDRDETGADDDEVPENVAAGQESILDLFQSQGATECSLNWHYRSRNEELIAFSNQTYYDSSLVSCPPSGNEAAAKGLTFNYDPTTRYEQGAGRRFNAKEARAVAERVIDHATHSPGLSLGVVAFSVAQRNRILDELEPLRKANPDCESFFNGQAAEPFFVKNLETVQGDERDVIFISICYGRMDNGRVTGSLGPVNQQGGERRLNVLITRAKMAMEVFCNFKPEELRTTDSSSQGVRDLKGFLAFAAGGRVDLPRETGGEADSPFEEQVGQTVRELGWEVEPQLGQSGFKIDIAVRGRNQPGRYILAIECDGASYHSSVSARDRDRLRQQLLEDKGWHFHRIWSADWFNSDAVDRRRRLEQVLQAAETASDNEHPETPDPGTTDAPAEVSEAHMGNGYQSIVDSVLSDLDPGSASSFVSTPYRFADLSGFIWLLWTDPSSYDMMRPLLTVVEQEGPLHINTAARRLADAMGRKKTERFLGLVESAAKEVGEIRINGGFLYPQTDFEVTVRDYSEFSGRDKSLEYVPVEEMQTALSNVVKAGVVVKRDEAIRHALDMLGFKGTTNNVELMNRIVSRSVESGLINRDAEGKLSEAASD